LSGSGPAAGRDAGLPRWAGDLLGLEIGEAEERVRARGAGTTVLWTGPAGSGRASGGTETSRVIRVRLLGPLILELTAARESPARVRGERP
jgi:hypothetical protein